MTTATLTQGKVSLQAVMDLVVEMVKEEKYHIHPNKVAPNSKFKNDAINEMIIDDEGNVLLSIAGSNEVILPALATVNI